MSVRELKYRKLRAQFWELTAKVLPSLMNLKTLVMFNDTLDRATQTMLSHTEFQLDVFKYHLVCDPEDQIFQALSKQQSLQHLYLHCDQSELPIDMCTSLISVECDLASFRKLVQTRHIKTLTLRDQVDIEYVLMDENERTLWRDALSRIRYLRIPALEDWLPKLAEVLFWDLDSCIK